MDGSYLLQMNLMSGRGSTSSRAAHGLGKGQGDNGRAIEHGSGGLGGSTSGSSSFPATTTATANDSC